MQNSHSAEIWKKSLSKAISYLKSARIPINEWAFGGGTALLHYYQHRYSKDIDIFLTDAQYLTMLTPRLNDFIGNDCEYAGAEEQSNFLKIKLKSKDFIDFIVAPNLTRNPHQKIKICGKIINVETPQEIVIKKIFYRADQFKSRDIFDFAVVIDNNKNELLLNLDVYKIKLPLLLRRCSMLKSVYLEEVNQLLLYRDQNYINGTYGKVIGFIEECMGM